MGSLKPLLAIACAALTLTACGGDDTAATDGETTTAVAAAATTAEAPASTEVPGATSEPASGCQAGEPPAVTPKTYSAAPAAPAGTTLTFETNCGTMTFALDPELGGAVTDSVAGLVADGFYDGLTFHRVVPEFVLQGGDPSGDGSGGPGYEVVAAPPADYAYKLGDLAMAKTADAPAGSGGSQFFVISGAQGEQLPPDYAVIGHATDPASLVTIAAIAALAVTDGPPSAPVWIISATVS